MMLPTRVLSVIVPVHDVEEYLPEFLSSLDAQGEALPADLIFIDDGSTDSSADLVAAWISGGRSGARMLRTENLGVSAARNTGLDEARGQWALFLDPDDVLAPGYFSALQAFLDAHPDVDLAATNLLRLQEPSPVLRDNHPLRFRFIGGDRVAELADDVFVMNAASVAFPLAAVRASGARFPADLHASEDALFVTEYLLSLGRTPVAGFVAGAKYGYRKRQARTSAVDRYRADPSTYTARFHDGYAPLLEKTAATGAVPSWLQSVLLYEMQWLLPVQMDPNRYAANLSEAQRSETLEGIRRCVTHVSDERLLTYEASALPLESRLLVLALTERPLWGWAGAYATAPRGWRRVADVVVYSTDAVADAEVGDTRTAWHPDYFGQRALVARLLRGDARARLVARRTVVWPRAGETLVETQDRHRRTVAGVTAPIVPARAGEVYVHCVRPWADAGPQIASMKRHSRRRQLWSKDAWIGRVLRPGASVLVEDDAEQRLGAFAARLSALRPTHRVGASSSGWRFGSLRHRVARARARLIVSASQAKAPSPQARLRGLRAIVVTAELTVAELLSIRHHSPELVVITDPSDIDRLRTIGIPADAVVLAPDATPESAARALSERLRVDPRISSRKSANLAA